MTLKQLLRNPTVKGICVGCCVNGSRLPDDVIAHAHLVKPDEQHPGFICVRSEKQLLSVDGRKASRALLHELAHLIANGHHGEPWRETMRSLGQPIPAAYRKPKRS